MSAPMSPNGLRPPPPCIRYSRRYEAPRHATHPKVTIHGVAAKQVQQARSTRPCVAARERNAQQEQGEKGHAPLPFCRRTAPALAVLCIVCWTPTSLPRACGGRPDEQGSIIAHPAVLRTCRRRQATVPTMHEYGSGNEAVLAGVNGVVNACAGHRPAGEGCQLGTPLRGEEPAAGCTARHQRHSDR